MDKASSIFNNEMSAKTVAKAEKGQQKLLKKFGDDRDKSYHLAFGDNAVLDELGTKLLVESDTQLNVLPQKPVAIGNIRMGFGHYRISMAMCSAAKALGYTPLWFDLNSFKNTTGGKIIDYQNDLYSMGSRMSQKVPAFNKLFWEPLNSEGFRKLSYNAADQKNAELMTPIFSDLGKDMPFVATHVWPAQAAVHAGMTHVVNAIPDNWQMGLHLAEGAVHTVQTPSAFLGYKTLRGMDGDKILSTMPRGSLYNVGHYIDHELAANIDADCDKRIARAEGGKPLRYLLTVGGAGAQQELFIAIIRALMPLVNAGKAVLFLNAGDHKNVLDDIKKAVPALSDGTLHTQYDKIKAFSQTALDGEVNGAHMFYSDDIYTAVYATNLLMRASDVLITKPSELAFYPVPKLFIKRVGGHEMWGAIHSAEIGDGTFECETIMQTLQMLKLLNDERGIVADMCRNIKKQNLIGTYNGAYNVIKLAVGEV